MHNILVVDDNQPFLSLITKIFDKFKNKYTIHTSSDGVFALDLLKKNNFSAVISDLQMPNMDGYALLEKIKNQFPDIPVIIITAFDKPKTESVVIKTGASAYFTKPLVVEELISCIDSLVSKETEGGQLNNASLEMFIQLIEMEAKTCTIRVLDEKTQRRGVLLFKEGELYNARFGSIIGKEAAYTIFSWDKVTLSIENSCLIENRLITDDLQAILLDAMRLKDEIGQSEEDFSETGESGNADKVNDDKNSTINQEEKNTSPEDMARKKLETILDLNKDLRSIKVDDEWSGFSAQATALGFYFDAGNLKGVYFDKNGSDNVIIVPADEDKNIEIIVGSKCSPERVIKAFTE